MKKLFSFLLITVLLFSLAVSSSAENGDDSSGGSQTVVIVPSESDLPEGYEIDPDFALRITLDAESGWSYTLMEELLANASGDEEYIYFFVEDNVADGYTPEYAEVAAVNAKARASSDDSGNSGGKVVIIKNIREGEAPTYELPESGGTGTTPYLIAGTAIILIATMFSMIHLYRKIKQRT